VTYSNWGCCGCNNAPYPNDSNQSDRIVFQANYPGCTGTQGFGPPWDDYVLSNWESGIERNFVVIEWSADCNNDGIVDYGQILQGQLADLNTDGVPDICQQPTCVDADIFRDFNVNGADLGILLSQWGPNTPLTRSDLNRDGVVDGSDLGIFLSFWGTCP
jgi:hypothetical protein